MESGTMMLWLRMTAEAIRWEPVKLFLSQSNGKTDLFVIFQLWFQQRFYAAVWIFSTATVILYFCVGL